MDDAGSFAGTYQSKPCFVAAGTTNVTLLPALTAGQYGEALALPPSMGWPVGWSNRRINEVNYSRPTRWEYIGGFGWTNLDLGSFDGVATTPGYAYGINDNGVTVGKSRVQVGGANAWRAFRATNSVISLGANALSLPAKPAGQADLTNNVANAVNANGAAAGATEVWVNLDGTGWAVQTHAAVWWEGDRNTNLVVLPRLEPKAMGAARQSGRSEVLGISAWRTDGKKPTIVGTAWATPTGGARAFVHEASDKYFQHSKTLNLNDPHLTFMPTGWTLYYGEGVNELGWIVGTGVGVGHAQQGFVLIPQATVAQ